MSYRKKHIKGKINKIKPKKSIFKAIWFWIIILLIIIITLVFYFVFLYSGIQVKNIKISGNQKVSSEEIKNFVLKDINNKILYVIDCKDIFLVNDDKITKDILKNFSDIEKVTINKEYPQTLSLKITERNPIGMYCQSDNCFSIDASGIIFEQNPANNNSLVIRQADNNNQVFTGEQVVNQNIMNIIYKIQKTLKDSFQIDLSQALIASSTRLNITTNENWQIYFDLSSDSNIDSQFTKLNALLSSGISADNRKKIRYIDLRPKDRAILCDNSTCGG